MFSGLIEIFQDPRAFFLGVLIVLPGYLIGLTLHEYGHAYFANKSGDDTAYLMGRLSFNPLKHIDWIGLVCLFLAGIGWAKPVMINPSRVGRNTSRSRRWWFISIAVAGIIVNLIVAFVLFFGWAIVCKFLPATAFVSRGFFLADNIIYAAIRINLALAFFNLLPVPPLDGYRFVSTCLRRPPFALQQIERYGIFIVWALALTGALGTYLNFFAGGTYTLMGKLAQLVGLM